MSNEEKKRLEEYKKKRLRLIFIQTSILVLLVLTCISLFFVYHNINQTYYVTYKESSSIDFEVSLKENDSKLDEVLGEDYAYVSTLINTVDAKFKYNLDFDADEVSMKIKTKATATVKIIDKNTGKALYKPVYELIPEKTQTISSSEVSLEIPLSILYELYDNEAKDFISKLDLKSTESTLVLDVIYEVESKCNDYENNNNTHTLSLNIPLNQQVVDFNESQSIPTVKEKVIACDKQTEKTAILIAGVISSILSLTSLVILVAFIYLTRNTHINYSIKVKKIVNAYKSFIQKIHNEFNMTGYQILYVNSIKEMLEIRDTLQLPILMFENEDKTKTEFVIPTNNNLLYLYEIKIDNYDEIYGLNETNLNLDSNNLDDSNEVVEEVLNSPEEVTAEIVEKAVEVVSKVEEQKIEAPAKEVAVSEEVKPVKVLPVNNYPKVVIENKGGHLIDVTIKTPNGDSNYRGNDKKAEIDLNNKTKK